MGEYRAALTKNIDTEILISLFFSMGRMWGDPEKITEEDLDKFIADYFYIMAASAEINPVFGRLGDMKKILVRAKEIKEKINSKAN